MISACFFANVFSLPNPDKLEAKLTSKTKKNKED